MESKLPEKKNNENHDDDEEFMDGEEDLDLESTEEDYEDEEEVSEDIETESELEGEEEVEEKEKAVAEHPLPTTTKTQISSKDIPIALVIEIGRVQMSLQKLLDLQPGNLLEMDVRPESGVDLVVNGKCIGKGELLRVGETLGVRILDLG